jgi:hypothetical protein
LPAYLEEAQDAGKEEICTLKSPLDKALLHHHSSPLLSYISEPALINMAQDVRDVFWECEVSVKSDRNNTL